jgi:hypothetical protein
LPVLRKMLNPVRALNLVSSQYSALHMIPSP